jgi:two-component sensor histidine kinase
VIAYYTTGYEGYSVTAFMIIFFFLASILDFRTYALMLVLAVILTFHFIILSFYPVKQPIGFVSHVFLLGLSSVFALGLNYILNIIKSNEARVIEEREILLKEVHHRVKNNLQVIVSLLSLQSGSISDNTTREAVKESQSRVKSMALIHQMLYQSDLFTGIDFSQYLNHLMSDLKSMYSRPDKDIQYSVIAENIELDIDTAIPLGIITNELASNAYKYAFIGRDRGKIDIRFVRNSESSYLLSLSDSGIGFPKSFNMEKSNTLGLKLVKLLSKQLKGKLEFSLNKGAEFKLLIPHAG